MMTEDEKKRLRALEEFMHQNLPLINQMDRDLYNHGKDGMKTQLTEFITRADERAKAKKEEDDKRSKIHFWWLGLLSALIVGLFFFILNAIENHHISQSPAPTQTSDARK